MHNDLNVAKIPVYTKPVLANTKPVLPKYADMNPFGRNTQKMKKMGAPRAKSARGLFLTPSQARCARASRAAHLIKTNNAQNLEEVK